MNVFQWTKESMSISQLIREQQYKRKHLMIHRLQTDTSTNTFLTARILLVMKRQGNETEKRPALRVMKEEMKIEKKEQLKEEKR